MINGVDVVHAILGHALNGGESGFASNGGDGVALNENVTACQKFESFESVSVRADETLTALGETFDVADVAADNKNHCFDAVFKDTKSLFKGDGTGEEADCIAAFDDGDWVPGFVSCADTEDAFFGVDAWDDAERGKGLFESGPDFEEVLLAVVREENSE